MGKASEQAIIPKTRAIFAHRIKPQEYIDLSRKRTVPEVAQYIKSHPYFKESLGSLSDNVPHRGQLEQILSRDIYFKFQSLMKYSNDQNGFETVFLIECEINELLSKLEILANGVVGTYITRLPSFLIGKLSIDLLELAKAKNIDECITLCKGTPYQKLLCEIKPKQGERLDYLLAENKLKSYYFETAVKYCEQHFTGKNLQDIESLFKMGAEIYNLDLIYRVKTYFENTFTTQKLESLLVPVYYKISKKKMYKLCEAKNITSLCSAYEALSAKKLYGKMSSHRGLPHSGDTLCHRARHILHFTTQPQIAASAVLVLARIERSNIISVIEGVRYGLSAEQIEKFIKY